MAAPRTLLTCLLSALGLLAGCNNAGSPGAFGTPPVGNAAGGVMEFRGQRGCADCQGIKGSLTLEQRGDERRYQLVEVYRGVDRELRFEDQGEWQSSGDLLRLKSTDGGQRVYRLLSDNRLQAADSRGRPLPAIAEEIMIPIGYANDR